jgi:predicted HTH domain antitoxin
MRRQITVNYPDSLATSLNLSGVDFEREMRVTSVVKLYELGRISSGVAAAALGLTRAELLDLLARYEVSVMVFGSTDELDDDIANA